MKFRELLNLVARRLNVRASNLDLDENDPRLSTLDARGVPGSVRFTVDADVRIEAAAPESAEGEDVEDGEDGEELPAFRMTAYTGGVMRQWFGRVIVDLEGARFNARTAILWNHIAGIQIAHSEQFERNGNTLELSGVVSGAGVVEQADKFVVMSRRGFPFQASIGAEIIRYEELEADGTAEVNGTTVQGPLIIARESFIDEVSVVTVGADRETQSIAASAAQQGERTMFEKWLKANGYDPASLQDDERKRLKAIFDQFNQLQASAGSREENADGESRRVEATRDGAPDEVRAMRERAAAELERQARINEIAAGHPDIAAAAIRDGDDPRDVRIRVLEARLDETPNTFNVGASRPETTQEHLEAAVGLTCGVSEERLIRAHGEQAVEAGSRMRGLSIRELVAEAARIDGISVPRTFGDGHAFIRAGFTSHSLSGLLSNVMNKVLLESYMANPTIATQVCRVGSVSDFKQVSRYRLLATGGFEKVQNGGELKSGALGEDTFTAQAETFGQVITLTRQDMINDDLGAFMELPRQMGLMAATSIDDEFFTKLLGLSVGGFWTDDQNYKDGADTAFDADALAAAKTMFRKLKAGPGSRESDKRYVNINPSIIMVPAEIETAAELLLGSAQLMMRGDTDEVRPVDNPHKGKYTVIGAPQLSDTDRYGASASAKAWYLLADPKRNAFFEIGRAHV